MSPPEVRLWLRLRAVADSSPRVRRQHPMGPYVLDFYYPQAKLCVEVDGASHGMGDTPARDAQRDAWLAARGVATLRLPAAEVMADADETAWAVLQAAVARSGPPPAAAPPPPPLRRGGD